MRRRTGWIPPVREIYPLIIGSMSFGALSPNMWEGLQMGVAYLNEELGMPVRMCTGEGGCPPRLLRSRFLKYVILQIASGYFGWDEIIHALPEMKEDPCAIEIKYGQGAKPGDGGLLMWYKVNKLIAAIRGVPVRGQPAQSADPPDKVFHRGIGGQDDPVHVHGLGFPGPRLSEDFRDLDGACRPEQPDAQSLRRRRWPSTGKTAAPGAAYNVSMNHMGHPIASNIRDAYLNLVKMGKQNEMPLFAGGGVGKNGNLAANAAALIMLGASGVQIGKYIMQAAAGCLGSEIDRCNICNIGLCPKGITSQDSRLYRRLDPGESGRTRGRCFSQLRHGTEEDRRAPGPFHVASHRHVRRAGHQRSPCRRASEHQICRLARGTSVMKWIQTDNDYYRISGMENGLRLDSRVLEERIQKAVESGNRCIEVEAYGQHGIGGRLWKAGDEPVLSESGLFRPAGGVHGLSQYPIEVHGPASDDVGLAERRRRKSSSMAMPANGAAMPWPRARSTSPATSVRAA